MLLHPCEASFEGEPCDLFHSGESCPLLHREVPCNSPHVGEIYSSSHPKSQETVIQFRDLTEKDYGSSDCEKTAFKEMLTVWFHYNLINGEANNFKMELFSDIHEGSGGC